MKYGLVLVEVCRSITCTLSIRKKPTMLPIFNICWISNNFRISQHFPNLRLVKKKIIIKLTIKYLNLKNALHKCLFKKCSSALGKVHSAHIPLTLPSQDFSFFPFVVGSPELSINEYKQNFMLEFKI